MKYALITGGTKGIGKAIGSGLLAKGYFVILNYSGDEGSANYTFEELNSKYPNQLILLKADLSKQENVLNFCNEIRKITQKLDVLILNAGKTDRTSFGQITYESWLSIFDTNLFVPFFLIQELHKLMANGSSVTLTGSLMGIRPHSLSIAYGVSKSAAHALVENMVKFLAPLGIRINAIAPGFTETDWQKAKSDELKSSISQKVSLSRFGKPKEVADAALLVIENKYMNGVILPIDGGYNFS